MTTVLTTSDPNIYTLPLYKIALLARPCRTCGTRLESLNCRQINVGFDAWQRPVSFDEMGQFIDACEPTALMGATS